MNKLLKYSGYLIVFIISVFVLLMILDKMGVGCLYDCEGDNKPIYGKVNNYINGKKVN
jgi:hypothetical protein